MLFNAFIFISFFFSYISYRLPCEKIIRKKGGNVAVNFNTSLIPPLHSIIIIFKDACLARFAHDPGKQVAECFQYDYK